MIAAARNLSAKALRRLGHAHRPLVRLMRRADRAREQAGHAAAARRVEQEIEAVARRGVPIVAGPWLAEVGYEALYWVPFLRWFCDAYRVPPERVIAVSRGGVERWYEGLGATYVDLFDVLGPAELVELNEQRQQQNEGGGRKQSSGSALDERFIAVVQERIGAREVAVLHPSLMFRLFRHVWHDVLGFDLLWTHARYVRASVPPRPAVPGLPSDYAAVKLYAGAALPDTDDNRQRLRDLVADIAASCPVVTLDSPATFDDHHDFLFDGIPNVISARAWMTPRTNLGLQTALAAHARLFLGTCGGLAWLTPFLGTPTVGVYADDRQLGTHLLVARQAGRRAGAAEFSLLDLRALGRLQLGQPRRVDVHRHP